MNKNYTEHLLGGSKFLAKYGYWQQDYCAYPALTPDEIFKGLVSCGVWRKLDTNPLDNLEASIELALSQNIFDDECLRNDGDYWVICTPTYGGGYDPLAYGNTIQEAICLYILRFPEIDLRNHDLPYEGWATRYDKGK